MRRRLSYSADGHRPEGHAATARDRAYERTGPDAAYERTGPDAAYERTGPDAAYERTGPDAAYERTGPEAAAERLRPEAARERRRPQRKPLVSTTSKSEPWSWLKSCSWSSFQLAFGAPVTYQGEPLSASSIP